MNSNRVDGALGPRALALVPLVLLLHALGCRLALLEPARVELPARDRPSAPRSARSTPPSAPSPSRLSRVRSSSAISLSHQPPIGARGFDPQKTWVPSIPTRCTSTVFNTMDLAVARSDAHGSAGGVCTRSRGRQGRSPSPSPCPLSRCIRGQEGFWNIQKIRKNPPDETSPICWTTAR